MKKSSKEKAKFQRSGLVYSLYLKNIRNLAIVAAILLGLSAWLLSGSWNYLRNYCFPKANLNMAQVQQTGFTDLTRQADTRPPSGNASPTMFELISESGMYTRAYWQGEDREHADYRFRVVLEDVQELGVYYDNTTRAWYDCADLADCQARLDKANEGAAIGTETYAVDRLLLVTIDGQKFLAAAKCTEDFVPGQKVKTVLSQMDACYLYDAAEGGCTETVSSLYADLRKTPVDYEDEDFKDAVMLVPISVVVGLLVILFLIFPLAHPIYRQLSRYGRTIPAAVRQVDEEYAAGEGISRQGKTVYMPTYMITRSFFMYVIRRNHLAEKQGSTFEKAQSFQQKQVEANKNSRYRR